MQYFVPLNYHKIRASSYTHLRLRAEGMALRLGGGTVRNWKSEKEPNMPSEKRTYLILSEYKKMIRRNTFQELNLTWK